MKKVILTILMLNAWALLLAQDFNKNLATARASYAAGDLNDSRFAMQQMLQDLDITIGKEVLKMLPAKMGAMSANTQDDNVVGNAGIAGVMIQRTYGTGKKTATLDIMNNSPLIASVNAILTMPFMNNTADDSQKVVKIGGYKSILHKYVDSESDEVSYDVQIPFGSSLLTYKVENTTEDEILAMANTIPLADIAKMVQ